MFGSNQEYEGSLIVKMYGGSHAYGTSLPTSDIDFRGIFVAPPVRIRTPFFPIKEQEDSSEMDTKYYELNQFMKLAMDCNPNIIELLWTDDKDIVFRTPAYDLLREAAPKLLCSKIAFTTSGYALAQLKRIKGHNKWLANPQDINPPRQADYVALVHNFTPVKTFKIDLHQHRKGYRLVSFGGETYGLYAAEGYETFSDDYTLNTNFEGDSHELGVPMYVVKFNKEQYLAAKEKWSQYWTWKKERNVVRSALEEQYGFDCKHAMHLVRLLRMGVEALTEGKIIVRRPDAEELLQIRAGAWTYEQVVAYAEETDRYVREDLYLKTKLPKTPNIKLAAQLILEVQDLIWNQNNNNER